MVRPMSLAGVVALVFVSSAASATPKAQPKPPAPKKVIKIKVHENIVPVRTPDYEGDAAKRLSAAFAKGDRARVVSELAVPVDYEKLHTDDERCTRQFGARGSVMRKADLDEFARCILLTVEFSEDAVVIPYDRFEERSVTMIKIDPKSHKVVEIIAGHHEGQAAGVVAGPS